MEDHAKTFKKLTLHSLLEKEKGKVIFKQAKVLTTVILTLTILLVSISAFPSAMATTSRIYLEPSNNIYTTDTAYVGMEFNVTVWCTGITENILGAQIALWFNDSIINVTRWWAPDWDANFFMPSPIAVIPTPPDNVGYVHVGAGQGYVKVAVAKGGLPPTAPWGTNGTIAIFEFNITAAPTEGGQLTSSLSINNIDTYLKDTANVDIPGVVKEDGSYTFIYIAAPLQPSMWLEMSPSTYEARKPRPFNVSIIVENVSQTLGLVGIQFIVSYNSTYLDATQIIQGDFLSNSTWAPYGTMVASYVDYRGVVYGELILPNGTGIYKPPFPEGNGTVAIITFLPILHAEASFNITITPLFDEFFISKEGEWLPYLAPKNCEYTYNPLPVSTLAVTPSEYIASHVGETFDVNVTLNNLDEQWNMIYAEFKLEYNNNYLQVLNVTEGNFLNQFGDTTFNHEELDGNVEMNITLSPTTYPSGSGTLAKITFNVTTCPGLSMLSLNDTKLLDFEMKDVLHEVQHGSYALHEVLVHPIVFLTETFYVVTVSNTCITPVPMSFDQLHMMLSFNVTGINGTVGFVNITIPRALLYASPTDWIVIVGGKAVEVTVVENTTYASLYFTFNSSSKTVYILGTSVIPEMTPNIFMLVLLAATIIGLAIAKTRLKKREERFNCKTPPTRL